MRRGKGRVDGQRSRVEGGRKCDILKCWQCKNQVGNMGSAWNSPPELQEFAYMGLL